MNVSPFLLLKKSVALSVVERMNAGFKKWASSWGVALEPKITCVPACSLSSVFFAEADWKRHSTSNGMDVWTKIPGSIHSHMQQSLFNLEGVDARAEKHLASSLATSIADDALNDLIQEMLIAAGKLEMLAGTQLAMTPPKQLIRPGSGAIVCSLNLGGKSVWILFPGSVIEDSSKLRKMPGKDGIVPLRDALKNVPVPLGVNVGVAELTIGYLDTLAVGDVLKLPRRLDQALKVTLQDETTICNAHLGSVKGALAVELTKTQLDD